MCHEPVRGCRGLAVALPTHRDGVESSESSLWRLGLYLLKEMQH